VFSKQRQGKNKQMFVDNSRDVAVADSLINYDSEKQEHTCKTFLCGTVGNYLEHKE
jgi:hypothetical protein